MAIIRLLLLIVAIWVVYRFIRGPIFTAVKRDKQHKQDKQDKPAKMVKCPYCSVYITKSDAYSCDDGFYCSYDHYRKMTSHSNNDPDKQ